jgi:molybdopterin converting factor small subunit
MTKKVIISQTMANHLEGTRRIEVNGDTVGEVLNDLVTRYPVIRPYALDSDGNLIQSLNVFLNEVEVRSLAGVNTPLQDEDVLIMVTPITGG